LSPRPATQPNGLLQVNIFTIGIILALIALQAGIESKTNLRVRFGKYGGLKLEYFWVLKSKKGKSSIRG
jgi:hypothetical protein